MKKILFGILISLIASLIIVPSVLANHSWGGYHWAKTANPFTLKLGDNLSNNWKPFLNTASNDWSQSDVLDTATVSGQARSNCKATLGRIEVCNKTYGNNGWLGIAQIWVNGSHITQATTKMNDTYFNTSTYNSPSWRQFVMCQEVGHTFGLDHQDVNFTNQNLGTCMDYTNDPSGTIYGQLSNLHPNTHDYDELDIIYSHLDSFTTILQTSKQSLGQTEIQNKDMENQGEWGRKVKDNGKIASFERDFGGGDMVYTFVVWAK